MAESTYTMEFGPTGNRIVSILGAIVALCLLAIFLGSMARVAQFTYDVWRAKNWTSTQANVMFVKTDAVNVPRRIGRFEVELRYNYVFDGKQYTGSRLVFAGLQGDKTTVWNGYWASRMAEFFENSRAVGRPVSVFVNPANPAEATVFRDMPWDHYVAASLLMLLLGVIPMVLAGRLYRNRARSTQHRARWGVMVFLVVFSIAGGWVSGWLA
jgi:hypothetical protein